MRAVEKAAHKGAASATRPAMQHDHGAAFGIAAFLDVKAVAITYVDGMSRIGFDRRMKAAM